MKKETNYIKLKYEFDSDYDDKYRKYDGEDFVYKIDEEDAKYDILKPEIKKLELDWNIYDLIDLFNNMCLWDVIFDEDTIEWLKDKYESDAMAWFKEQHLIEEEEE
jgi:hypothetical protein